MTIKPCQNSVIENIGDETHVFYYGDSFTITCCYSGGFLTTVLKSIQREVTEMSYRLTGSIDSNYATSFSRRVIAQLSLFLHHYGILTDKHLECRVLLQEVCVVFLKGNSIGFLCNSNIAVEAMFAIESSVGKMRGFRMTEIDLSTYDPMDSEDQQCPFAHYEALRNHGPIFFHEQTGMFFASRLDIVNEIVRDTETFSSQMSNTTTKPDAEKASRRPTIGIRCLSLAAGRRYGHAVLPGYHTRISSQ